MSIATTHENYAHTWWTTPEWVDWVTETLGEGWSDPCPKDWDGIDRPDLVYDRSYWNYPGSRGGTQEFWRRAMKSIDAGGKAMWCAFSAEQPRHMRPSPWKIPGWMIMPRVRIGFTWGGPDIVTNKLAVSSGAEPKWRRHGDLGSSPGNWTIFWSSVEPAEPPSECVIVRTGA